MRYYNLLNNPIVNTTVTPVSTGGIDAAMCQAGANQNQKGSAFDTADFADTTLGNLPVDYVLPSQNLKITDAKVFWAKNEDPLFRLVGDFNLNIPSGFPSSDHRLVAADVALKQDGDINKKTITDIKFLGKTQFQTNLTFNNTQVGGLSGITYDPARNVYYSISDDRSSLNPARFFTLQRKLINKWFN